VSAEPFDNHHPHDVVGKTIPDRLNAETIRRLSRLDSKRAMAAIASEWAGIVAAIGLAASIEHALAVLVVLPWIGARQHALAIIAHDAAHFRLLSNRHYNNWIGNLFAAWPVFISVEGFRHFHGDHHRHVNQHGDGNRPLWNTHTHEGQVTPEWRYPKTALALAGTVVRRALFLTGLRWMLRGLIGGFLFGVSPLSAAVRLSLFVAAALILTATGTWRGFVLFWMLPYCTWHIAIQYVRLICEHSAVETGDARYADTRTTIPGPLGRWFVLPRSIGYHIEHHFYPSVPFYRLPELHLALSAELGFRESAVVRHSISASLRDCVIQAASPHVARS
jgi:fatty acid desaturase